MTREKAKQIIKESMESIRSKQLKEALIEADFADLRLVKDIASIATSSLAGWDVFEEVIGKRG